MNKYVLKSVCQDEVMQYFKEMPSMHGQIDDEELEEVSNYIYDFEAETIKILGTHDENNKSKKGI